MMVGFQVKEDLSVSARVAWICEPLKKNLVARRQTKEDLSVSVMVARICEPWKKNS